MKKLFAVILCFVMVFSLICLAGCGKNEQTNDEGWMPKKTVTFYLYAGPGGDTDTAMRALAACWQKKYGQTFNVVNMTGGAGGIAANYVYGQPADGYTLFGMADGCSTMNVIGAFDQTNDVWDMMVLFGGVGCIGVPKDSPYDSLEDLIDAAKAGENIRLSCSSAGTIWHVNACQTASKLGVDINILPYDGSSQAIVGMLANEVDVVCSSLGEQSEYIKSGDIRPLTVLTNSDRTIDGYQGTIPAISSIYSEFAGFEFARQWNGVGIRNDADQEIKDFYEKAFMEAVNSGELDSVKVARNTEYIGIIGDEARTFVNTCTSACSWTMWDLGIATKNPEDFGIERMK